MLLAYLGGVLRYDLVRGNALKVLVVLGLTPLDVRRDREARGAHVRRDVDAGGDLEDVPVRDHQLQLRRRWGRAPQHRVHVERRREQLAQDARRGAADREIRKERRMA